MSNVGTSLPPASQQDHVEAIVSFAVRQLQNGSMSKSRGRTALTVLYLIVLGFCFLTPVLYYFRLHWEERHAARLQQLENEIIRQSLRQANNNREESRAARRKSVEERRARMLQLFEPVRMFLKPENFPDIKAVESGVASDVETEDTVTCIASEASSTALDVDDNDDNEDDSDNPYGEDDTAMVRLPTAGLHYSTASNGTEPEQRLASGLCTICLSIYKVGSDVVWSSNAACEHVFHQDCIEKWLIKQREGPLCPCCRRDFIVDPFDVADFDHSGDSAGPPNTETPSISARNPRFEWDGTNAVEEEEEEENEDA